MVLKDIIYKIMTDNNGALYLSKKESAKVLGVSVGTLNNYRSLGQIKAIRRGRKITFSVEVLAMVMRDGIDAKGMKNHIINDFSLKNK
jgi:hypothetical protein